MNGLWTTSRPTAVGLYWCYNSWRGGPWHLDFCKAVRAANDHLIIIRAGAEILPSQPDPDRREFWHPLEAPPLPDVSSLT